MDVQFFLNDLPRNDFNQIFQLLEQFERSIAQNCACKGLQPPPHYIVGVPGSFYTRLFPCNSVHLFHSSFSLMWLSQVPEHLDGNMNEGNIHIGETTPLSVAKLYQDQFEKDFSRCGTKNLSQVAIYMVLTVPGRKSNDMFHAGGMTIAFELLSKALHTLVAKGHVEKGELDSFNVPIYLPSADELRQLVQKNELLDIGDIHIISTSWNPMDDDLGPAVDGAAAAQAAGKSISATLRAGMESLIMSHFRESIVDELFAVFVRNITNHIENVVEMSSLTVISLSLQARQ
uniref:Jasmonate O-methyltransferase n=1 Tax=Leersia perrieri TaxID=77586 RepID=A0A0D9XQY4_9ORYZ